MTLTLIMHKESKKIAIRCGTQSVSYHDLYLKCRKLADELTKYNVDVIGLLMDNSIEFIIGFYGILLSEKSVLLLNSNYGQREVLELLNISAVEVVVSLSKFKAKIPDNIQLVKIDNPQRSDNKTILNANRKDDDVAIIIPTSGTTGIPKLVMLTHDSLDYLIQKIKQIHNVKTGERELVVLPLSSIYAVTTQLLICIYAEMELIILEGKFDIKNLFQVCAKYRPIYSEMVPTMLKAIALYYNPRDGYLSSLRRITLGGEKITADDLRIIQEKFSDVILLQGYGMSESGALITEKMYDDYKIKLDSVGKPFGDVQIKIVSDNDKKLGENEIGEILVKGPNMMAGYFPVRENFQDNWFATGDLGYIDEDGYLYICGRKKNLIISSGYNVMPEEIEAIIMKSEKVKEVKVYGEKSYTTGEIIVADVVFYDNDTADTIELQKFCKRNLAAYKIPKKINIVDKLERTITHKVRR